MSSNEQLIDWCLTTHQHTKVKGAGNWFSQLRIANEIQTVVNKTEQKKQMQTTNFAYKMAPSQVVAKICAEYDRWQFESQLA